MKLKVYTVWNLINIRIAPLIRNSIAPFRVKNYVLRVYDNNCYRAAQRRHYGWSSILLTLWLIKIYIAPLQNMNYEFGENMVSVGAYKPAVRGPKPPLKP